MRTPRYFIRLFLTFVSRFKAILLIGILLGVILFISIKFISPIISTNSEKRIGVIGRYHPDDLPVTILQFISEGLTMVDINGFVKPGLAKSWKALEGGKIWEFQIDENRLWQDGQKLESKDINYEFEDITTQKPNSFTISFNLQTPLSTFPIVVSKQVFKRGLLGTGKWKVTDLSLSGGFVQKLILRNKSEKKIYKFYPTEERTKLAFKLGEIDIIEDLIDPSPFDKWNTVQVTKSVDQNRFIAVFFNTEDKILSEKSIRQALSYAIDKDQFESTRAISPITPFSWAYNPQVKTYNYDVERAKKLISELPQNVKDSLSIKLVTSPFLLNTAEVIAKQWTNIGVKTNVQVTSIVPVEFQAYLAIYDIPLDPDQYSIWHSTQSTTNISRYKNPRIDKLLEDGRTELDMENRKRIYLDFQRYLLEDAPAAFLFHPNYYQVKRK